VNKLLTVLLSAAVISLPVAVIATPATSTPAKAKLVKKSSTHKFVAQHNTVASAN
jgi:hypothetical protein